MEHRRYLMRLMQVPATHMNLHLQYSQAIQGRATGVIDMIHLVEVAKAIEVLDGSPAYSRSEAAAIKQWFAEYLR